MWTSTLSKRARMAIAVSAFLSSAACASTSPGDVSGSLAGKPVVLRSGGFMTWTKGANPEEVVVLVLSDQPDVCGAIADGTLRVELGGATSSRAHEHAIVWLIFGRSPGGEPGPVAPGVVVFGIPGFEGRSRTPPPPGGTAFGYPTFVANDRRCFDAGAHQPDDGWSSRTEPLHTKLNLRVLSTETASGELAVRASGRWMKGSFEARSCGPFHRETGRQPPCR